MDPKRGSSHLDARKPIAVSEKKRYQGGMLAAATMESVPEPERPHRSFGSGKIMRSDSYGHVDVSVIPRPFPTELTVEWNVFGETIPSDQREIVIAASQRVLDSAAAERRLRCGVRLIIESGSYHDSFRSAHAEAAESAVTDALERGNFIRQERET